MPIALVLSTCTPVALREILRIDHIGNERAAERQDDLGAGLVDQPADELRGDVEDLVLALLDVLAVDADRPDVADEAVEPVACAGCASV